MSQHHAIYQRSDMLDLTELSRRVRMSPDKIESLIRTKLFPLPTTGMIPGKYLWIESEIEDWIGKRWIARC